MRSLYSLFVLLLVSAVTNAQNYIPKPPAMTSCPTGYTYTTFGNNNVASLGTFPATQTILANYIMTTLFNGTAGVVVSQLSFGITDNTNIASVVNLRLALFRVTQQDQLSPQLVLLSQTDEIQLYATAPDIIYGNLLQNVTMQPGLYAIGVWANTAIRTGIAPVQAGAIRNVPYQYYYSSGLPTMPSVNSYTYGYRALQAHGCLPAANPYTDPNNQVINFCAYLQSNIQSQVPTSYQYQYTPQTQTLTLGGQLAVSNSDIGSSNQGQWGRVVAGYATMSTQLSSMYYYQSMSQSTETLVVGDGSSHDYDQQLFLDINGPRVDSRGVSFSSITGSQIVISYVNGTYQITRYRGGSYTRYTAVMSGFTTSPGSSAPPTCIPPTDYVPDSMTCEAGSLTMNYGDSDPENARFLYNSATSYLYANYLYTRNFIAFDAGVTLRQLSIYVIDNPGIIAKIRMGIFASEPGAQYPTLTLISQTREVTLKNVVRGVVRINLQTPLALEQGRNYTIGFMTDQSIYGAYGYWIYNPSYYGLPYDRFMTATGFPQTVSTVTTNYIAATGATGCKPQATTRQYGFCAAFVYASYSTTYRGVVDVIALPNTADLGTYYQIVGGTGTYNQTYTTGTTAPRIFPFRFNNYNHPANYRLYTAPTTPGRHVDSNGIAFIIQQISGTSSTGIAGSISTFYDPMSASWEFIERQQTMSSTTVTTVSNLISEMRIVEGGVAPECVPPPKPLNTVSPATVARFVCPNNANTISEVFGDASVGNFAVNVDGTLIEANKVYTHSFLATSTATVHQIAIGILRNTDRLYQIRVRLGLYQASNNALLVQANQLVLNQAVDQLIVMNLPSVVSVTAGQTYYIALIADQPLEVATSSVPNSPSMISTFSTSGLPTTFIPGPNAPSVSIAVYTCASSTHSFCAYYQYYDAAMGRSLTYLYQGLMQVSGQGTDPYGTYNTIYAASGKLVQYSRTTTSVSSVVTVFTFHQQPDNEARLYTQSANNRPLNGEGMRLLMSTGSESILNFNASNNMMDESFQSTNLDVNLRFADFRYSVLGADQPLPACGMSTIPSSMPANPPEVTCPGGESVLIHGSANTEELEYPRDSYGVAANTAVFNIFTTGPQATLVHQLKHGFLQNRNFINRLRMGLYSANLTYLASTETIQLNNPTNGVVAAPLTRSQYLAPNTVYYVGVWSEHSMSTGYGSSYATSFTVPFASGQWPTVFDLNTGTTYNNERALAVIGCTTPVVRPADPSTAGPQPRPSSSSTGSQQQTSIPAVPSSTSAPAPTPSSSTGSEASVPPVTISTSSDGLSKGAVAGIVIGCVIATNLMLALCLWFLCLGTAAGKAASTDTEVESSRVA